MYIENKHLCSGYLVPSSIATIINLIFFDTTPHRRSNAIELIFSTTQNGVPTFERKRRTQLRQDPVVVPVLRARYLSPVNTPVFFSAYDVPATLSISPVKTLPSHSNDLRCKPLSWACCSVRAHILRERLLGPKPHPRTSHRVSNIRLTLVPSYPPAQMTRGPWPASR